MTFKSTDKDYLSTEYNLFLKKYFPEHRKRAVKARSQASTARFFYPILFFLVPLFIFGSILATAVFFKELLVKILQQTSLSDFAHEGTIQTVGIFVFIIGLVISLFFFFIGVSYGFSKARELLFESEKLEIATRQLWTLENLSKEKTTHQNLYEKKQVSTADNGKYPQNDLGEPSLVDAL